MSAFDPDDGGNDSRKLRLTQQGMLVIFTAWILINVFPFLDGSFSTLVTAVVALITGYAGANIGNKFVVGKNINVAAAAATSALLVPSNPLAPAQPLRASADLPEDVDLPSGR